MSVYSLTRVVSENTQFLFHLRYDRLRSGKFLFSSIEVVQEGFRLGKFVRRYLNQSFDFFDLDVSPFFNLILFVNNLNALLQNFSFDLRKCQN